MTLQPRCDCITILPFNSPPPHPLFNGLDVVHTPGLHRRRPVTAPS